MSTALERTLRLILAYDGTAYSGWQRQKNRPTVQAAVEAALARVIGRPTTITGAGRTDAGVHALGQACGLAASTRLSAPELARALNALLPEDIRIIQAEEAAPGFHARRHASAKRYCYHVYNGPEPPLFFRRYLWAVSRDLSIESLEAAMDALPGEHDFAAFQSVGSQVKGTRRTIHRAELSAQGRLLTFLFEADGFLRHMVRALVGTLIEQPEPQKMIEIIQSGRRSRAGRTAPPQGLFLVWVRYPDQAAPVTAPGPFDPWE